MATMASEVKFDFIFEIGNHNYPGIHVHIMPITATLVASEAMAASKQHWKSYDLRFEISNLDYPGIHVHIASNSHFGGL